MDLSGSPRRRPAAGAKARRRTRLAARRSCSPYPAAACPWVTRSPVRSALVAAAELPAQVGAVVSRGGRPDLAAEALPKVQAPTLLIVGGKDNVVIGLNEQAKAQMRCEVKLEIISGATHLFEEPGALERVAQLASEWFGRHTAARRVPPHGGKAGSHGAKLKTDDPHEVSQPQPLCQKKASSDA